MAHWIHRLLQGSVFSVSDMLMCLFQNEHSRKAGTESGSAPPHGGADGWNKRWVQQLLFLCALESVTRFPSPKGEKRVEALLIPTCYRGITYWLCLAQCCSQGAGDRQGTDRPQSTEQQGLQQRGDTEAPGDSASQLGRLPKRSRDMKAQWAQADKGSGSVFPARNSLCEAQDYENTRPARVTAVVCLWRQRVQVAQAERRVEGWAGGTGGEEGGGVGEAAHLLSPG